MTQPGMQGAIPNLPFSKQECEEQFPISHSQSRNARSNSQSPTLKADTLVLCQGSSSLLPEEKNRQEELATRV